MLHPRRVEAEIAVVVGTPDLGGVDEDRREIVHPWMLGLRAGAAACQGPCQDVDHECQRITAMITERQDRASFEEVLRPGARPSVPVHDLAWRQWVAAIGGSHDLAAGRRRNRRVHDDRIAAAPRQADAHRIDRHAPVLAAERGHQQDFGVAAAGGVDELHRQDPLSCGHFRPASEPPEMADIAQRHRCRTEFARPGDAVPDDDLAGDLAEAAIAVETRQRAHVRDEPGLLDRAARCLSRDGRDRWARAARRENRDRADLPRRARERRSSLPPRRSRRPQTRSKRRQRGDRTGSAPSRLVLAVMIVGIRHRPPPVCAASTSRLPTSA